MKPAAELHPIIAELRRGTRDMRVVVVCDELVARLGVQPQRAGTSSQSGTAGSGGSGAGGDGLAQFKAARKKYMRDYMRDHRQGVRRRPRKK